MKRNHCNAKKWGKLIVLLLICIVVLAACVPGDGRNTPKHPAGFFSGVWHGWIAPVSLVMSIFNHNIHIYEVNNNGLAYEVGFYIAIISGFGTVALRRKRHKTDKE